MGGVLQVTSEPGIGSCFSIVLKNVEIASLESLEPTEGDNADQNIIFGHARLLLVDDMADNRALIKSFLDNTPIEIIEAENGRQALNILAKQEVDIILMDIRMPVLDGKQATIKLRETLDTPVIALSASVLSSENDLFEQSIFNDFLHKPIQKKELFSLLARYLATKQIIQAHNKNENNSWTEADKQFLPELLNALQALHEQWEMIQSNNNLTQIMNFTGMLKNIYQNYPVKALNNYIEALQNALDSVDILAIKRLLDSYPDMLEKWRQQKQ